MCWFGWWVLGLVLQWLGVWVGDVVVGVFCFGLGVCGWGLQGCVVVVVRYFGVVCFSIMVVVVVVVWICLEFVVVFMYFKILGCSFILYIGMDMEICGFQFFVCFFLYGFFVLFFFGQFGLQIGWLLVLDCEWLGMFGCVFV